MSDDELSILLGLSPSHAGRSSPAIAPKPVAKINSQDDLKPRVKLPVATRSIPSTSIETESSQHKLTRASEIDPKPELSPDVPSSSELSGEDSDRPKKQTVMTQPRPTPTTDSNVDRSYALPSDSLWMYSAARQDVEKHSEIKEKDFADEAADKPATIQDEGRDVASDVKLEEVVEADARPPTGQSLLDQLMRALEMQEDRSTEMARGPTSSTLDEGVTTADESFLTETEDKPRRRFHVAMHQSRIRGSNRRRTRYQIVRYIRPWAEVSAAALAETEDIKPEIETVPDTPFQRDVQSALSRSTLDQITELAKIDNTSGNHLPSQLRDLFPALADPAQAITIANHLRRQFGLPPLSTKTDRVALRRAVAQMRLSLYTELVSALLLPSAPYPTPDTDDEDEREKRNKISLVPSAVVHMQKALPAAFPNEKYTIKLFLAHHGVFGEPKGKVVWQDGIGKMVGGDPTGPGFRGKISNDGLVHVFVDHSNVLYGLTSSLHKVQSSALPPRHLRTLSLPILSLLLRRGRPTPHGSLHLVASSPVQQNLDPLVRLGWEVSVLKRVEIYDDEVYDTHSAKMVPKPQSSLVKVNAFHEGGSRRFKEQGVDEILHLKILQALNTKPTPAPKGSTIVLATGDAKGGQFNQDGFMGAVREAIKRGWMVELWSFRDGLSRAWKDVKRKENWDGNFTIRVLDEWAEQLVEVGDGD